MHGNSNIKIQRSKRYPRITTYHLIYRTKNRCKFLFL